MAVPRKAAAATALCGLLAAPLPVLAQWQVTIAPTEAGGVKSRPTAMVGSAQGHSLSVYLGKDGQVFAELGLVGELATLEPTGCPSYRIDSNEILATASADLPCQTTAYTARFTLGVIRNNEVGSKRLLDIMNGSRLEIIYHLRALGYETTTFSLGGSKQAITRILGDEVRVVEE